MPKILIHSAPEADFVRPYLQAELAGWTIVAPGDPDAEAIDAAVMLSSVRIYSVDAPSPVDEDAETDRRSPWLQAEEEFTAQARRLGCPCVVFRCADIVGTGMTGFPAQLAADIDRGFFFHFPGNEARRSVIHATDVAKAVRAASTNVAAVNGQVLNLTDGNNPTLHDLAEAIAYRLNEKRISNLSTPFQQWVGRIIYGRRYAEYVADQIFDGSRAVRLLGLSPTPVVHYLRTHIYDENSL